MKLAKLKFNNKGKIVIAKTNDIEVKVGSAVVCENDNTLNLAKVISLFDGDEDNECASIIRLATEKDTLDNIENITAANSALRKCMKLVKKYNLDMRLIDATYTLDRKQLVFQFTADNRVDFRDLAKELASIYKTRIELRQIGVRDKAKCVGGLGTCGKELCCAQYLNEMDTVSINMAKNQKLALNPSKINGVCGRLLCCLKYEDEQYCKLKEGLPEVGDTVKTDEGEGVVTSVNICNRTYKVDVPSHGNVEVSMN